MIKKDSRKKSKTALVADIMGAVAAIGLLSFQLLFSEEDINRSLFLHSVQITLVTLAALGATGIAYFAIKSKRDAK